LKGKVAAPVYKTEINDHGNPLRSPRDTLYPKKLALTSPTRGGRSVGIVRSRTKAMEFSLVFFMPGHWQQSYIFRNASNQSPQGPKQFYTTNSQVT
jgi:hypothetical protein